MAEEITSKRAPQPIPTLSIKGQVAIVLFVCSATGWVLASVKGFCREPTCYCPVAIVVWCLGVTCMAFLVLDGKTGQQAQDPSLIKRGVKRD
mmetsp:Transcript_8097/g.18659  ORF Transcript_8097/g.18659 Transcript_8097/m.18659 type:complete len:92 (+) Transcript_8097:184-459(+)